MNSETDLLMPIKIQAYEHQKRAFEFIMDQFGIFTGIKKSPGVALLMEMGTGKTVTSIAAAGCMYQFGKIEKVLIVCPLSITSVWEDEFEKFAAFPYSLCILSGSLNNKKAQIETLRNHGLKVIVVNYESARKLEEDLSAFRPDLIIADEGHKIKDGKAKQSAVMHRLGAKAKYRLLLTGTIITNKEIDVYSQYKFLNPKVFGNSFLAFRNRYFEMLGYGGNIPVFRRYLSADFLRKLHSIAFRVTKEECLELPAIMEEERILDLEPKAKALYRKIEKESYADLDKSKVSTLNILTKTLRLSQLTGGHLTDDKGTVITVDDTKLQATEEVIDMVLEENKKLVIMARFVPEISDIEELLKEKGIKYSIIRGGVKDSA